MGVSCLALTWKPWRSRDRAAVPSVVASLQAVIAEGASKQLGWNGG